ncbi:MAG: hypothetical protein ACSLFQ_00540 [Thermoanaerobaculia bacterium]
MSGENAARVHYFDRQFLRVEEFRDEQLYQLSLRRRHNNTQHTWGIVAGLLVQVDAESGSPVVRQGFAVDGYGRSLHLDADYHVAPQSFDDLGTDRLDLWLVYRRRDDQAGPNGYGGCGSTDGAPPYRSTERPEVLVEAPRSNNVDARRPPGVPADALDAILPPLSDDPADPWRVYLGRIIRQPDGSISVDLSRRPYAGAVAEAVDHPGNAARIEIGRQVPEKHERRVGDRVYEYDNANAKPFAVYVPEDVAPAQDGPVELAPRLEVRADGIIGLRGKTEIHGNLRLAGGAIQFVDSVLLTQESAPESPSMYRLKQDAGGDELRIDLGKAAPGTRRFVIGFSSPDGKFTPVVTISEEESEGAHQCVVRIDGDLEVEGSLVAKEGVPSIMVGPEAMAALKAAFLQGLNEGNSP